MKHTKLFILIGTLSLLLCACSSTPTSKQTRNDLTSEHFNGLSADMHRSDVEDLVGKSDSALAENESFEMYSLADGSVALLRYAGDKLQAAYIRGKDNIERAIFSNYADGSNIIDDGTTDDNTNGNNTTDNNATDNNTENNTSDDNMNSNNMPDGALSDDNSSGNNENNTNNNMSSGNDSTNNSTNNKMFNESSNMSESE